AAKLGSDVSAVIWTTTPWTIPHNRALAFHPDYEYVVVETEEGKLLLAADRVAALQAECDLKKARVLAKFKGHHFEHAKFKHPFLAFEVPGVLATYVTLDQGSGIVHTAPGTASTTSTPAKNTVSRPPLPWTTAASTPKACPSTKARMFSKRIPSS